MHIRVVYCLLQNHVALKCPGHFFSKIKCQQCLKFLRMFISVWFTSSNSATMRPLLLVISVPDWERAPLQNTCQFWFDRFCSGDKSLKDRIRSGRPADCDIEALLALAEDNPRITISELEVELGCTHTTIEYRLHQLGKVSKHGSWVPHKLTSANLQHRVKICNSFLSRGTFRSFFGKLSLGMKSGCFTSVAGASTSGWIGTNSQNQSLRGDLHPEMIPYFPINSPGADYLSEEFWAPNIFAK